MSGAMNQTGKILARYALAALVAAVAVMQLWAQERPAEKPPETPREKPAEKPKTEADEDKPMKAEASKPANDGHDRPTTYPSIRIGPRAKNDAGDAGARAPAAKLKTHAYLIDVTDAMGASINVQGRETTRLDLLLSQMGSSLDGFSGRADLRFNIVTIGPVMDFAAGAEHLAFTAENVKKAKDWLAALVCSGNGDMYALLKAVFDQAPDGVSLLAGSMPGKPAGVTEEELKKHASVSAFVLAQVKAWVAAGKKTTLDITGIGLTQEEAKFYDELARATGGVYLNLGS